MSKQRKDEHEAEDEMDIDVEPRLERSDYADSRTRASSVPLAIVLQDEPQWLSHIRRLLSTDIIILLTPVVVPIPQDLTDRSDPFEPLGRSLSTRHARIRHVPYTQRNGITSTHLGFIKRGHAIILCLAVQPLQLELAEVTFAVSDNKPVIVVCCSPLDTQRALPFPTILQVAGFSRPALEATAALIFAEPVQSATGSLSNALRAGILQPRLWRVEEFEEQRDMPSILILWSEYGGVRFKLDQQTFANLLRKPGYSKHYVVRDPPTGEAIGFCATYLSYVDREGEKLVASLAILVVHPKRRLQGIGLSLHSHAITQLKRTRGIIRLQLGSTFPRILYGPPSDMKSSDGWLHRRGWLLDRGSPGQGQAVYDLILDFKDWQYSSGLSSTGTDYRLCTQDDMTKVLEVVEKASTADDRLGWFDQYWALINGPNVKDIVVATEGYSIVGTALTYRPGSSQISSDLPWSYQIGNDVGGVTCVSISCEYLPILNYFIILGFMEPTKWYKVCPLCLGHIHHCEHAPNPPCNIPPSLLVHSSCFNVNGGAAQAKRDAVLGGLINICVENLQSQGMTRLFLDGVTGSPSDYINLGFREWAKYRDVWKSV